MAAKKLNKKETKKLIPALKGFNKLAEVFIGLLHKKIERQKKKVHKIKVLVNDFQVPVQTSHNISIQTVDINTTTIKRKGELKYNQKMDWESEFRKPNKGLIL